MLLKICNTEFGERKWQEFSGNIEIQLPSGKTISFDLRTDERTGEEVIGLNSGLSEDMAVLPRASNSIRIKFMR